MNGRMNGRAQSEWMNLVMADGTIAIGHHSKEIVYPGEISAAFTIYAPK
jgi:hypothetical protein